jgi:hypothetical protein
MKIFHTSNYDKTITIRANHDTLKSWLVEKTPWTKRFCAAAARVAIESTVGIITLGPNSLVWSRGRFTLEINH